MGSQVLSSVENNFTKGLVTEFTGLNFPENAATDCDNCEFTLVGDVLRREGIDFEENFQEWSLNRAGAAVNTYKWNNAGGDGNTQVLVVQVAGVLKFWISSAATVAAPLSTHISASTVTLSSFTAAGGTFDTTLECQFSTGNGYLFVYHPSCDPIYCTYNAGTITGNRIIVQIRDFTGVPDSLAANTRPTVLTVEHNYNLINQGWVAGNPWLTTSVSPVVVGLGSKVFTVDAGLTVTLGDQVTIIANHVSPGLPVTGPMMSGNITAYSGTTMTINVTSGSTAWFGQTGTDWLIVPRNTAYIATWFSAVGNYPSNSDVWWYFKNASQVFDPATTLNNVTLGAGLGPRGHVILDAFSQQRDVVSSLAITDIQTTIRPKTGTWFQGRVWYTGVDAQQPATGDANYYTWTENIYFSKIVNTVDDFGHCYQVNDPTSENLFDLLPTDGGVIQIQGSGSIYKLFPIQNGMLVFAANGIWFITGSQGIGFSANDYTITKISSVQSISSTSFVNVQGLPYFWNEEGIYTVQPAKSGGLEVNPITVGTILSFYNEIPVSSKKYARGDYHPIDYVIQWTYRSTEANSVTDRYTFDKILNFNDYNKAFYPYTVSSPHISINGINYIASPGGSSAPQPAFKYLTTNLSPAGLTWSDERDTSYLDWVSDDGGANYVSYFVTGYKLHGQGQRRFQIPYIYVFSRSDVPTSYKIQGLWDYAISGNSGRWSTAQLINNWSPNFGMIFRRHKIRGQGLVLQLKVTSADGQPFDILGWSTYETQNTGV
jgi:hypothetical protein